MQRDFAKYSVGYVLLFSLFLSGCQQSAPKKQESADACVSNRDSCASPVLLSEYKKQQGTKSQSLYQQTLIDIQSMLDQLSADWVAADYTAILSHYWPNKSPIENIGSKQWEQQVYKGMPNGKAMLRFYDVELLNVTSREQNHIQIRVKQERQKGRVHDFTFKSLSLVNVEGRWLIDKEKDISYTLLSLPESPLEYANTQRLKGKSQPLKVSQRSNSRCPSISDIKSGRLHVIQLIVSSQFDGVKRFVASISGDAYIYQSITGNYVGVYGVYSEKNDAIKQVKRVQEKGDAPRDMFIAELKPDRVKRVFCFE